VIDDHIHKTAIYSHPKVKFWGLQIIFNDLFSLSHGEYLTLESHNNLTPIANIMSEEKQHHGRHPPDRDAVPTLASLGVDLHPDTYRYCEDSQALADAIGGNSTCFTSASLLASC
jgi:hypothetical protein